MRILVTGGAGFVGGSLAVALAGEHEVVALDNLHRPGSRLNLPRLEQAGVQFVEADVRDLAALERLQRIDALVECSAEPSVLAGVGGDPRYAVETNLIGAYHCLELCRRDDAQLVFLSTSRVYPVAELLALPLVDEPTRFAIAGEGTGYSPRGISEAFAIGGVRTLYGATKLSAEHLIAEYGAAYGLPTVIDRCGVIAGPWQMGKVDQGVFTFWMAAHLFGRPLRYLGFGGTGRQVRDLLHVGDLVALVDEQLGAPEHWAGVTVNVGGGRETSLSLRETTDLCAEISGRAVEVLADGTDRPGDIPLYLSDCARLHAMTAWRPRRTARDVLQDIHDWITAHRDKLERVL